MLVLDIKEADYIFEEPNIFPNGRLDIANYRSASNVNNGLGIYIYEYL